MEYHNFQQKRGLEGVQYQSSAASKKPEEKAAKKESFVESATVLSAATDLSESNANTGNAYLFNHRADMNDADIPYGHIKTRGDVHLNDEIELQDTYTTVNTLLAMAGVSALIFGGMVWANA